jgi:hypothetical protein
MMASVIANKHMNLGLHVGKVHDGCASCQSSGRNRLEGSGSTILRLPESGLEVIQGQIGDARLQVVEIHGGGGSKS